jgi:hypothetical protein
MKFRGKEKFGFKNTLQNERGGTVVLNIPTGEMFMNSCRGKGKAQPRRSHEDQEVE